METTDESLLMGMKREKDEEIGGGVKIQVLPDETYNLLFRKKDGNSMIIPHIAGIYVSGDIRLNDEYSEYAWVSIAALDTFEPKIATIPAVVSWAFAKLADPEIRLVEI